MQTTKSSTIPAAAKEAIFAVKSMIMITTDRIHLVQTIPVLSDHYRIYNPICLDAVYQFFHLIIIKYLERMILKKVCLEDEV